MIKNDDFKLLRGYADRQTIERTNKWTFVTVELLLQLKIGNISEIKGDQKKK